MCDPVLDRIFEKRGTPVADREKAEMFVREQAKKLFPNPTPCFAPEKSNQFYSILYHSPLFASFNGDDIMDVVSHFTMLSSR